MPTSLNLLPGQIHMLKEAVQKETERKQNSPPSAETSCPSYVTLQADMPASVSKTLVTFALLLTMFMAKRCCYNCKCVNWYLTELSAFSFSEKKEKKPDMLEFCFLWKEVKIDSNARNILCICIPLEFNYIPSSAADEWHICVIPIAVTTMSPAWRPSCFLTEKSKEETCCWDLEAMGAPSLSAPGRTWTGTHTHRTQI